MIKIKLPTQKMYPRKIFLRDDCWKIVFKKNLDCYGITDSGNNTITIKSGLAPRALLATFIHELMHAIEFNTPLKIKHKDVYALEEAIVELLLDNFLVETEEEAKIAKDKAPKVPVCGNEPVTDKIGDITGKKGE